LAQSKLSELALLIHLSKFP